MKTFITCLALLLAIAGCDNSPTGNVLPTVPASGTLTLNGVPLDYYRVLFSPQDGRPAMATTDAEGRFTLGTNDVGDGAMVGMHRVTVSYVGPPSNDPNEGITVFTTPPPSKHKVPPKFTSTATSDLMVEVPASGSDALVVNLK